MNSLKIPKRLLFLLDRMADQQKFIEEFEIFLKEEIVTSLKKQYFTKILHRSLLRGMIIVSKYAIDKGVHMDEKFLFEHTNPGNAIYQGMNLDSFETAILIESRDNVCQIVIEKGLEMCSPFGLTQLHVECAKGNWVEVEKLLEPDVINKSIDIESPLWKGMTPLLIAAKFCRTDVADRLVELGANPFVQEPEGHTPLHFLYRYKITRKEWFAFDYEHAFGSFPESYFHIACSFCPDTLDIVKKYLERGISPNLTMEEEIHYANTKKWKGRLVMTGLHIAVDKECPQLVKLLLEYGAEVDKPWFANHNMKESVLHYCRDHYFKSDGIETLSNTLCLLFEAGTKSDIPTISPWITRISNDSYAKLIFLRCVKKLIVVDEKAVDKYLKKYYQKIINIELASPNIERRFDEITYGELCVKELEKLERLGLKLELYYENTIRSDFKEQFNNFNVIPDVYQIFPIYGFLLKVKLRHRLMDYEKKKEKIRNAIPIICRLVKNVCNLPVICADEILWNLSTDELDTVAEIFRTNT